VAVDRRHAAARLTQRRQTRLASCRRVRLPAALLVTALALAVAGCGGDDDPPSGATAPGGAAETQVAEQGRTTEQAPEGQSAGTGRLTLQRVGEFASPTTVTAPPGDERRLFVVEQGGRIRVVRDGEVLDQPFLDISRRVTAGGEQGLLGLAFAPDYAQSRRFYVNYTDRLGETRIAEFRSRSDDAADPGTERLVLGAPGLEPNHNGGQLAFGPDRMLYIGLGDGGGANDQHGRRGNAQDLGSVLGKILRIDVSGEPGARPYRIPRDNPFRARDGARPEVWAYGLRNPWRFAFDRETGDLTIADVGQDAVEEVNFVSRERGSGGNFGWRPWEGTRRVFASEEAPGHIRPVLELPHERGFCSVTGGYVVRDPGLPSLTGRYVFGDFCDGRVRSTRLTADGASGARPLPVPRVGAISTFGEDARGRIYVASLEGPVFQLVEG
jgi:glucose/arabinose dehydrogenase